MTEDHKLILITGANSPLGSATVNHLLSATDHSLFAIVSPWSKDYHDLPNSVRLTIIVSDLTADFSDELNSALSAADRIFHFAWIREKTIAEAISINSRIAHKIAAASSSPSHVTFISSVGASTNAVSVYGRSKWIVSEDVLKFGGSVLVCGLVECQPPQGPHKLLVDTVKRLPARVRFVSPRVPVFPTPLNILLDASAAITNMSIEPGIYRLYSSSPIDLNDFIKKIEQTSPRIRIPIPIFTGLVVNLFKIFQLIKLGPFSVGDKILTFLVKDRTSLQSYKLLPGINLND